MPITLNHSNISVQYSTGSNYIIETVKSDLYRRNDNYDNIVRNNLQTAPVTPSIYIENGTNNVYALESYTYSGSANTADYTRVFPKNTLCDILVVGGGGGGDSQIGGGGGGGAVLYATNISIPANTYTIKVGKGGAQNVNGGNSEAFGAICLGGGSTSQVTWPTQNNGSSGGSGSGSSPGSSGGGSGGGVGISTKGTLLNSGTLYNGNLGGNSLGQIGSPWHVIAGGGGGAGSAGSSSSTTQYTTRASYIEAGKPGKGGDGVAIDILGTTYYWAAGGGGGSSVTHAGDGGLGGGGGGGANGSLGGLAGTNGINNGGNGINSGAINGGDGATSSGSGGGGGGEGTVNNAGAGGSGIVIIRYLLGTIPTTNLLTTEPSITLATFTETFRSFIHSGGAEAQTTHTITVGRDTICDILVVGGGGGGGSRHAGGGGAGAVIYSTNITLTAGTYTIGVGKGGNGAVGGSVIGQGNRGEDSIITFNSTNIYLAKGGGAGYHGIATGNSNKDGGSGGGGEVSGLAVSTNIPSGTYGNSGGIISTGEPYQYAGGGGGGSGTAGSNATIVSGFGRAGNGGNGTQISITGTNVYYGGGGGGGTYTNANNIAGTGGLGGGGAGSKGTATAVSGTAGTGGGGGGGGFLDANNGPGGAGGSGIVIIRLKSFAGPILEGITHKRLNFLYEQPLIYNFTQYNTEATWKAYAATIPNFTYFFNNWFRTDFFPNSIYGGDFTVGWFQMTLPSGYNYVSVFYGSGGWTSSGYSVRLLINGVEKSSVINVTNNVENTTTYSQAYTPGDILRVEETYANLTSDIIITLTNTNPNTYTLNFPVPTLADINNNSNIVLRGAYDIALSTSNAVIIPKADQYIPKPTTFTNYAVERMYPPVRNFTAATTTVSGQTYGNGTYVVSYSSTVGSSVDPWTCFNTGATTGGHWADSRYTAGVFNNTSFIVAGYLGDWVKIQLPVAIKLTRFNFVSRPTYQVRSPKDFKIYGSNDNITWVELVNKTDALYNASNIYEQTTPEITNTYTYYGLVVNKIFNDNVLNFDEWYIYGQEASTSSLSLRYHLLNPILDPIGAQWTYNSSNTNVYHMGSVGIGTTIPEYQLDVRGAIYSSVGGYTQTGLTTWTVTSDKRIKDNIVRASYDKCLENVKNIELYNFNFKNNCVNTNDKHQLGFIAQEVQQVYPKAVEVGKMILNTNEAIDDILTLNTTQIDYTLYGAVKNLIEKIEDIDNDLESIEKLI